MEKNNTQGDKDKKNKVSWNLAEQLIQELGDLLKEASYYYTRKDFDRAFGILQAIRMRIVDRLTDDELDKLVCKETQLYLLGKQKTKKGDFQQPTTKSIESAYQFWKGLDEYNTILLRVMRKYGYLMGSKTDKTVLNI